MSSNYGRVSARGQAAVRWLAGYDPGDGGPVIGAEDASDAAMMFSQPTVIDAFEAGMTERLQVGIMRGDDAALTVQTLRDRAKSPPGVFTDKDAERAANVVEAMWHELGEARRLIEDAASLFRAYGRHHREQAEGMERHTPVTALAYRDRIDKAVRNEAMAARLDEWLNPGSSGPFDVAAAYTTTDGSDLAECMEAASRLKPVHVVIDDGGIERHVADPFVASRDAARRSADRDLRYMAECRITPADRWRLHFREEGRQARREGLGIEDCPLLPRMPGGPDLFAGVCPGAEWINGWREVEEGREGGPTFEACRDMFDNLNFGERRAANFDFELYDRLMHVSRSPLRKAWDWLIGRPSPGFKQGGLIQPSYTDDHVPVRVSPPERFDTAGDTATLRLQTPDPAFDPAKPVLINGFPFHPATKGQ